MKILKKYEPLSSHVFRTLSSIAEEEDIDARIADYLRREASAISASIAMEDVKALLKKIEKIAERLRWLRRLARAKQGVADIEAVEQRFRILKAIQRHFDSIKTMRNMAEKLSDPERTNVLLELKRAEQKLARLQNQAYEVLDRLAQGLMPPEVKNLGDRIRMFFQRRLPRNGASIEVKRMAFPGSNNVIDDPKPRVLFAYYLIFKNVPRYSDPKQRTDLVATLIFEYNETARIPYIAVSKEVVPPTHVRKVPLEARTWKEALKAVVREAVANDALLISNPLKLKPKVSVFSKHGFNMRGVDVKVDKSSTIIVSYKIGTHKELGGPKRGPLTLYEGRDAHVTVENGQVREVRPTKELDDKVLSATAEALNVKPSSLKLVRVEVVPNQRLIRYYFRYVVSPEDVMEV